MKGLGKLKEKLPDYQGKRIIKFLVVVIMIFISSLIFQFIMDSIPRILRNIAFLQILAPFTPIFASLMVIIIGFILVYFFWRSRDKYLIKYDDLAYQKAFKFVITGIPMVISVVIHSFFPIDLILSYQDNQNLNWYLGTPISEIFFSFSIIFFSIRLILWLIFVALGLIVIYRSLQIFGIDYMGLIYVYYPDESTLQEHEIFSILRHPTYHAVMLLSIGGIIFRFSIYSLIYFFLFMIGINIHLRFVEEKELIKRFGDQYKKYRENVPAIFVKFKDLKRYFSIIFK